MDKLSEQAHVPFIDKLTPAEFDTSHAADRPSDLTEVPGKISMMENNPEVIVRVDPFADQETLRDAKKMESVLREMRNKYQIPVPTHEMVIGSHIDTRQREEQVTLYQVTQRIHPASIEDNLSDATQKFNVYYSALAQYAFDSAQKGKLSMDDLTGPIDQEVYGKREGDDENNVWFVDLDIILNPRRKPGNFSGFNIHPKNILSKINEFEKSYGVRLVVAERKVQELVASLP